jgi:hypothetical protein
MAFETLIYYAGFGFALWLCWGLGPVFFYPMLADLAFDICMSSGLFSGWDIRPLVAVYGLAVVIWVVALLGKLTNTTFVAVLLMDVAMIFYQIVPDIQMVGTGQEFWNATSVGIYEVWLLSIFVMVVSMALRSSVWAKIQGRRVDLLTNPKKRFLIPLGAWAGIPPLMSFLEPNIPSWVFDQRYVIASHVLVWGWVAFELPPYLMIRRLRKRFP